MKEKETRLAWNLHVEATNDQFATKELNLGPWTSYSLINDPKHMAFVLSRYKFCAKMLDGKSSVLEVGCGDAFGAPIVAQAVDKLHCIDWEERNTEGNRRRLSTLKNITFDTVDISVDTLPGKYDGIFNIDVIEHLEPEYEKAFVENMVQCLDPQGVMIIGTPNETASEHATFRSDHQHINLKTADSLKSLMDNYFHNTFVFSMNDELIHTGYYPMAHYLFAMGVGKK
ncbi:MAG: methyltransferase domain-containing protein [Nitrospina sp.]|jgi:2-polyprenyl-3-methyl-5-hydroxy-6-metoxy-1,4-benzoquinol methylase|nr:methyltransferase domain-containing protein [Nitrospina sp.]